MQLIMNRSSSIKKSSIFRILDLPFYFYLIPKYAVASVSHFTALLLRCLSQGLSTDAVKSKAGCHDNQVM